MQPYRNINTKACPYTLLLQNPKQLFTSGRAVQTTTAWRPRYLGQAKAWATLVQDTFPSTNAVENLAPLAEESLFGRLGRSGYEQVDQLLASVKWGERW